MKKQHITSILFIFMSALILSCNPVKRLTKAKERLYEAYQFGMLGKDNSTVINSEYTTRPVIKFDSVFSLVLFKPIEVSIGKDTFSFELLDSNILNFQRKAALDTTLVNHSILFDNQTNSYTNYFWFAGIMLLVAVFFGWLLWLMFSAFARILNKLL